MNIRENRIEVYHLPNGKRPFEIWLQNLNDKKTIARILQRLDRIRLGNFGDCKNLGAGVYELRIFWGPGYRIYFGLLKFKAVLLLIGGDKASQKKDVATAQEYWKEFQKNAAQKL